MEYIDGARLRWGKPTKGTQDEEANFLLKGVSPFPSFPSLLSATPFLRYYYYYYLSFTRSWKYEIPQEVDINPIPESVPVLWGVNRVESAAKESERSGRRTWKYAEGGIEVEVDGGTMTDVAMYLLRLSVDSGIT